MSSVRFALDGRAYDVVVQSGALDDLAAFFAGAKLDKCSGIALVADRACGPALDRASAALEQLDIPLHVLSYDVDETLKSTAVLDELYGRFIDARLDRAMVVVALGGGVIGDLAGFAAATYLRGVRWVGIPTTLLAAVDSSVGGKTGVNHARGKNLIGAIHQPSLVVVDPQCFTTLPARETLSGYGEMLKYGLALDPALWNDLIASGPAVTLAQIERCIAIKADIVAADEHDLLGRREILNFGHTVAHAVEAATAYRRYRHGEAVVIGMRAAVHLSVLRGHLSSELAAQVDAKLANVDVPPLPRLDRDVLRAAIGRDKKRAAGGATRFVLLREIGATLPDADVDGATLDATLDFVTAACA